MASLPDLECSTQIGPITLHSYTSTPLLILTVDAPYTPVATTELGEVARLSNEFVERGVKVVVVTRGSVDAVQGWIVDVKAATGQQIDFPIVCDTTGEIATALTATSGCHVIYAAASRSILFDLQYPSTAGRNFHEILRLVDAVAHTKATGMHTPVNWIKGGDTCVPVDGKEGGDATVIDLPSLKPYLRMVAEK